MGIPEAVNFFEEAEALSTLIRHLTDPRVPTQNAIDFVRHTLPLIDRDSAEGSLISASMAKILRVNIPEPDFLPVSGPSDQQEFAVITRAWIHWARKDLDQASHAIQFAPLYAAKGSLLHIMVLRPWRDAVRSLIISHPREAQRMFHRSMEMGCQIGTETNSAIQWSYVASFHR